MRQVWTRQACLLGVSTAPGQAQGAARANDDTAGGIRKRFVATNKLTVAGALPHLFTD